MAAARVSKPAVGGGAVMGGGVSVDEGGAEVVVASTELAGIELDIPGTRLSDILDTRLSEA